MGRSKAKKQKKTSAIFKVAGHQVLKSKGKPKAVTTNLKKINYKNQQQMSKVNAQLKHLRDEMPAKTLKLEHKATPKKFNEISQPVDVDGAMFAIKKL